MPPPDVVPEDGTAAVATWVSSPPPSRVSDAGQISPVTIVSSESDSLAGPMGTSTGQGASPVTNFIASFGPVPHITPSEAAKLDETDAALANNVSV